ncbi:MAG: MFS transporter [Thermoleophilia bacterium]
MRFKVTESLFSPGEDPCREEAEPGRLPMNSRCGWWLLTATVLGSSMAFVDMSVVNVALPVIERDLDTGFAGLQWIVDAYMLVLGCLLLLGGRLGDVYGRRRIFIIGLLAFAAASLAAAISPSDLTLIGARAVQGVGAALMIPGSLAIITATIRGRDRGQAIGAWSGLTALATAGGPLLGGWLVQTTSWRFIFLINLPVAVVAAFITYRHVPESYDRSVDQLDVPGAVLAVAALAGLIYAPIEGPRLGWSSPSVLIALAGGIALSAALLVYESRQDQPLLPLEFFKVRQFWGTNLATLFIYAALNANFFLFVIQLQRRIGYGPLGAGAALTPVTIFLLVGSPLAGRLVGRIGPRLPMTLGPLIAAIGLYLIGGISADSAEPTWDSYLRDILPPVLAFSLGLALTVAPLTTAALSALEAAQAGLASGVNNAAARVAGLLGIALIPLAAGISGTSELGGADFGQGFTRAMLISAGLCVAGAVIAYMTVSGEPPGQDDRG